MKAANNYVVIIMMKVHCAALVTSSIARNSLIISRHCFCFVCFFIPNVQFVDIKQGATGAFFNHQADPVPTPFQFYPWSFIVHTEGSILLHDALGLWALPTILLKLERKLVIDLANKFKHLLGH